MKIKSVLLLLAALLLFTGCNEEALPKPKAMLRLEYPNTEYSLLDTKYFQFKKNLLSEFEQKNNNALTLDYPTLKGSLFITYKEVDNNIDKLFTILIANLYTIDYNLSKLLMKSQVEIPNLICFIRK